MTISTNFLTLITVDIVNHHAAGGNRRLPDPRTELQVTQRTGLPQWRLALMLGMTVALAPLALDTYLPAFPLIAESFRVDHAAVGVTMSAYVAVLGAAQLVGGPLSDRYSRWWILFAGLAIFFVASVMIAATETLQGMLGWRLVQALGGGWCAVSVPAIVRDYTRGNEAARLFSLIGLMMFAAPALAPAIGSLVLAAVDWHGIFLVLAAYAALLALVLRLQLFPVLRTKPSTDAALATLATNYLLVLRNAAAMRFILLQAMVFSIMLTFVTHASFIYQGWFGLSNTAFSALFAANVAGMAVANVVNRRLLRTASSLSILLAAVSVQATAVFLLTAVTMWGSPHLVVVAPLLVITMASMGAIAPNNIANALEPFPVLGGTASALMGATQFTLAGAVSGLSTIVADGTLAPIVSIMAIGSVIALSLAWSARTAAPARSAEAVPGAARSAS